ncbi:MAG TPA: sugar phosphate isomerase/epimerase [Longimicrobiales bacterium]
MPQSRRSFLATLGAAAIGTMVHPACATVRGSLLGRIGLQLYTVRNEMERDLEATLEQIAAIGYREVEFAGYFERSATQIAALLERLELTSPSTHIGYDQMRDDWSRTLDTALTIGHTYITIPWIAPEQRRTIADWERTAALFNERAATARARGLRFAYHNHDFEFAQTDGTVPFDLLLANTDPELVEFELDIYWITRAGFDPLRYFERYPGRFRLTHLKDSAGPPEHRMVDVGSGQIDFAGVIAAANAAGVRHHFVEHDQPAEPFASIRSSYQYLAALETR